MIREDGGQQGESMSLFDAYIFIDWSAATRPSRQQPTKDAIWIGELISGLSRTVTTYHRLRSSAASCILCALMDHVRERRRVLVGFDFPYGYPVGFAKALGVTPPQPGWYATWQFLAGQIHDQEDNSNNRFQIAAGINGRISSSPGPFWCVPKQHQSCIPRRKPDYPFMAEVPLSEYRHTEMYLISNLNYRPQTMWKLFTAGSVGGQALVGIPYVHMLRGHCRLTGCSRVWPFETGFTPLPSPDHGPFILHAEIWPGMVRERVQHLVNGDPSLIRDQAQVRAMCEWAAELDDRDELGWLFCEPNGLNPQQVKECIEEEGWILGAVGG
jgi:hypothetical protein